MSNARNLADLLGTGTTITDTKLNSSLDLSGKTLTMPSGISLFKRAYHGDMGSTVQAWTTSFTTLITIPNVVVNSGEKVYLSYTSTARHTSTGAHHTAYRLTYSGSSSGSVGDGGWGFGINDSLNSWQLDTNFICLNEFPETPFSATGTFTFNFQGKSSATNGYWNSEANAVHTGYSNVACSIYVGEG
jgi:hypothetical protein